jgi:hypothetical protein
MKLKLNLFFLLSILAITCAKSQVLDSISMTFEGGLVVVRYDFLDGEEGQDYELYLYGSHDNFVNPLQHTIGDVGKKIKIGSGKIIHWDAKKELGNFKGDISLKVKGAKYVPIVSFKNIDEDLKIKRGNVFDIKWIGAKNTDKVLLKIQRHGVPVSEPLIIDNSGSFTWEIPSNLKAGKGYSVQIMDPNNLLREETSQLFSIKRKVPLAYIIAPIAIIAGVTAVLLTQDDPQTGIPDPPSTPEN